MSEDERKLVRFLCVEVKSGETQEKLKAKVLKTISNSEKKTTPTPISHPLRTWNEEVHTHQELAAEDVVKVASNSSYVTFLLSNGQVCRLQMSSREESHSSKTFKNLDALRRSGATSCQGERFQVVGDEEYAQQLQTELNSATMVGPDWNRNRNIHIPSMVNEYMVGMIGEQLADTETQNPFLFNSHLVPEAAGDDGFSDMWR